MDEELENSTRKMQQNMNFSPEVSFQPTESQASVSINKFRIPTMFRPDNSEQIKNPCFSYLNIWKIYSMKMIT